MIKIEIIINHDGSYAIDTQMEGKHESVNNYLAKNESVNMKIKELVKEIVEEESEKTK